MICGIDASNYEQHACVWCKFPRLERWDMSQEWSISDTAKGARIIEEIARLASTKQRSSTVARNLCFYLLLYTRVVIDILHLFLRISDVLIILLICDLRTTDEIHRNGDKYINIYEEFLNSKCKI